MIIRLTKVHLKILKALSKARRSSVQDLIKSTGLSRDLTIGALQTLKRRNLAKGDSRYQITEKGAKFLEDPITSASQVLDRIGPAMVHPISWASGSPIVELQKLLAYERGHGKTFRLNYYFPKEVVLGLSVMMQAEGDTIKGFDDPWQALASAGQIFKWAISTREIQATQLTLPDKLYDFADFRDCPKELLAFFPFAKAKLESQEHGSRNHD